MSVSPRAIDVSKPTVGRKVTVLVYGESGSGKTRFASTFPRPRFFADKTEGGWETLYDPDLKKEWWEPSWTPQVRAIGSLQDLNEENRLLEEDIRKGGPLAPQSLVMDSMTFFMILLEEHYRANFSEEIAKNHFFLWGRIREQALKWLRRYHSLGLHVVWTALAEQGEKGFGPLITGQTAKTLPAACKYILYARTQQGAKVGDPPIYELRTKKYGNWPARVRGKFPDPLKPSFRAFATAAGILPAPTVQTAVAR